MTRDEAWRTVGLEQMMIPRGASNRPGTGITPKFITIHNTDNATAGADARAHGRYLAGADARARKVSWHFTVDDQRVCQHLGTGELGWHAGSGPGNRQSVGIEICMNAGIDQAAANRRAAHLTALLLHDLDLPLSAVVQHHHWTGKDCPRLLRQGNGWPTFIAAVQAFRAQIGAAPEPAPDPGAPSPWAAEAWAWAQSEGLLDGTRPRDTVTREELALVMKRAAG